MANMVNMAFLTNIELHNVAGRMGPITKSVQNGLTIRAEQAASFTGLEDMADIGKISSGRPLYGTTVERRERQRPQRLPDPYGAQHRQLYRPLYMIKTKTVFLVQV